LFTSNLHVIYLPVAWQNTFHVHNQVKINTPLHVKLCENIYFVQRYITLANFNFLFLLGFFFTCMQIKDMTLGISYLTKCYCHALHHPAPRHLEKYDEHMYHHPRGFWSRLFTLVCLYMLFYITCKNSIFIYLKNSDEAHYSMQLLRS